MIDKQICESLLEQAANASLRAGSAVMEIYNRPITLTEVSPLPIDEANFIAQDIIKESLGSTRIPILSEEGREMHYGERCNWELFWLVDPLDGRVEFINRNNEFTINIALMFKGRAILGVIYVPYLKRLYFAERGHGASLCEGVGSSVNYQDLMRCRKLLPTNKESRSQQRVAITRSHQNDETFSHIEMIRSSHPMLDIIEQGSSYKLCMLAAGDVDYYARCSDTFEWDTAAGELILIESGGRIVNFDNGEPLLYNKEQLKNPYFKCYSHNSLIK